MRRENDVFRVVMTTQTPRCSECSSTLNLFYWEIAPRKGCGCPPYTPDELCVSDKRRTSCRSCLSRNDCCTDLGDTMEFCSFGDGQDTFCECGEVNIYVYRCWLVGQQPDWPCHTARCVWQGKIWREYARACGVEEYTSKGDLLGKLPENALELIWAQRYADHLDGLDSEVYNRIMERLWPSKPCRPLSVYAASIASDATVSSTELTTESTAVSCEICNQRVGTVANTKGAQGHAPLNK